MASAAAHRRTTKMGLDEPIASKSGFSLPGLERTLYCMANPKWARILFCDGVVTRL
jgi:hypothetical protein